jgi:hypothetical protein
MSKALYYKANHSKGYAISELHSWTSEPNLETHRDVRNRRRLLKIVTWLILPVVICLSQRLSHACLSINNSIPWNCEWLIKSVIVYLIVPYYLDNRGNSRANTCKKTRLLEGLYLLDKKPIRVKPVYWWFIITSRIAWPWAGDVSFKFLPYQLSMVG